MRSLSHKQARPGKTANCQLWPYVAINQTSRGCSGCHYQPVISRQIGAPTVNIIAGRAPAQFDAAARDVPNDICRVYTMFVFSTADLRPPVRESFNYMWACTKLWGVYSLLDSTFVCQSVNVSICILQRSGDYHLIDKACTRAASLDRR